MTTKNTDKTTRGTDLALAATRQHRQTPLCYRTGAPVASSLASLEAGVLHGTIKEGKRGSFAVIGSKPVGRWSDLTNGEKTQVRMVFRTHNEALIAVWKGDGSTGETVQREDKADRVDANADALGVSELEALQTQRDQLAAVHATKSTDLSGALADLDAKIAALTPDPALGGLDADKCELLAALFAEIADVLRS